MKILHIASSVAEQSASWRIHKSLMKFNIDSSVYVLNPSIVDDKVIYGNGTFKDKIEYKIRRMLGSRLENTVISKLSKIAETPMSLGWCSAVNRNFVDKLNPDIINLHWICGGFVNLSDIRWLAKKYPIVWTLHDSWAFTGGCHIPYNCDKYYTGGCKNCKQALPKYGFDIIDYNFKRKKKAYNDLPMYIVGVSKWLADCAKRSQLFENKDINVIHNTLDMNLFRPRNKHTIREILGLNLNKKYILFGAMNSTSDRNKGFDLLSAALNKIRDELKETTEILIFGSNMPKKQPNFGLPVHYLGRFADDLSLAMLYNAADVMLVPSRSESFSNTCLESMSSGTGVVAFRIGGIGDQIDHLINGYMAEPYDTDDLAMGIKCALANSIEWGRKAREKAELAFNENKIANEYIDLYKKLL